MPNFYKSPAPHWLDIFGWLCSLATIGVVFWSRREGQGRRGSGGRSPPRTGPQAIRIFMKGPEYGRRPRLRSDSRRRLRSARIPKGSRSSALPPSSCSPWRASCLSPTTTVRFTTVRFRPPSVTSAPASSTKFRPPNRDSLTRYKKVTITDPATKQQRTVINLPLERAMELRNRSESRDCFLSWSKPTPVKTAADPLAALPVLPGGSVPWRLALRYGIPPLPITLRENMARSSSIPREFSSPRLPSLSRRTRPSPIN